MAPIQGKCDPRFEEVRSLLQNFVANGEEVGAAISVNLKGEDVLDIWGGHTDESPEKEWAEDTIVNVFSSTKLVLSLAILMLVDRKVLSVNDKISKFWPEFAANGKENIEIRHILSHTSGVSGWDTDRQLSFDEITNLDQFFTAKLAAQAPWWTPGSASGYHTWTFGHLLSEVVWRATGKSLRDFVVEEIVKPLGADFQFGVAESDLPRTANIIPAPLPPLGAGVGPQPGSITFKTMNPAPMPANYANTPSWRKGNVIAASGHTNARALARILSAISLGGSLGDRHLLSRETIDQIFAEQSNGVDLVIGAPLRFGVGYGLTGEGGTVVADWLPNGRVCFWGGMGGSIAIMDLDRQLTITYVMNKMSNSGLGNDAVKMYVKAIYKALKDA